MRVLEGCWPLSAAARWGGSECSGDGVVWRPWAQLQVIHRGLPSLVFDSSETLHADVGYISSRLDCKQRRALLQPNSHTGVIRAMRRWGPSAQAFKMQFCPKFLLAADPALEYGRTEGH